MFKRIIRSKKIKSRVRWILILIMVPPFVLFFHMWRGSRQGRGPGGTAGVVFGKSIAWEDFQQEYNLMSRNLIENLGEIPQEFEPMIRLQVWDRIILREAAKKRVKVSNDELAAFIRSQPTFQENGRFIPQIYQRFVRAMGMTPQVFEDRLRDDLRSQKLVNIIKSRASIGDYEVKEAYMRENEQIKAALVIIDSDQFKKQAKEKITPELLTEYYQKNKERFRTPTKKTFEYIGVSMEKAKTSMTSPSEDQVSAYYEDNPNNFNKEDGTPKTLEEAKDDIIKTLAEEAAFRHLTNLELDFQDDIDAGLGFEQISASRNLKINRTDSMQTPVLSINDGPSSAILNEAFNMEEKDTPEIKRDGSGVFIIRLADTISSRIPELDEIKTEIEPQALKEEQLKEARTKIDEIREKLSTKIKEGSVIEKASEELKLNVTETEIFTKKQPALQLKEEKDAVDAIFALKPGEVSDVIRISNGYIVGWVTQRLSADESKFENEKDALHKELLEKRQEEYFQQWFDSLRSQAHLKNFLN